MQPDMIPALSMISAQAKVSGKAGELMLAKTLDTNEQAGAALIDMMKHSMELSVNPHIGSNFDASV